MSGSGPPSTYLLRFVALDGEIHFRVKKRTRILKAMKMFSEKLGKPLSSIRFFFKRTKIKRDDTPLKLRMKVDDYIYVLNIKDVNIREQAKLLKSKIESMKKGRVIRLRVISKMSNLSPIDFLVKPTTSLKKLLNAYSENSGIGVQHLRFTFHDESIREDHTPQSLKMKQDDIIVVEKKDEEIEVTMERLNIL